MQRAEFQTAVERLQALPNETKADLGPKLNRYLNKLDDLRSVLTPILRAAPQNRPATYSGWKRNTVTWQRERDDEPLRFPSEANVFCAQDHPSTTLGSRN